MKSKYKINAVALQAFLLSLNKNEIESYPKTGEEKLFFHNILGKNPIPNDELIEYGEPFLVDALGNDLSICVASRRKYKLPDGRAIHAKFVVTLVPDCQATYGTALNGVWKIPSQFLTKIQPCKTTQSQT